MGGVPAGPLDGGACSACPAWRQGSGPARHGRRIEECLGRCVGAVRRLLEHNRFSILSAATLGRLNSPPCSPETGMGLTMVRAATSDRDPSTPRSRALPFGRTRPNGTSPQPGSATTRAGQMRAVRRGRQTFREPAPGLLRCHQGRTSGSAARLGAVAKVLLQRARPDLGCRLGRCCRRPVQGCCGRP